MKNEIIKIVDKYADKRRNAGNIKWEVKRRFGNDTLSYITDIGGRSFNESLFMYINSLADIPLCLHCNNKFKRFNNIFDGYDDACSKKCKNMLKYGVDNPAKADSVKRKMRDTNLTKFGGPSPLYDDSVKMKIKDTCVDKYGVDHYSKTGLHMQSYLEKTGYSTPLSNPKVREQILDTNLTKYGGTSPMASKCVRDKVSNTRKGMKYDCGRGQQVAFYNRMLHLYAIDIEFEFSEVEYTGTHSGSSYKRYPFKCNRCSEQFEDIFDHSGIRCPKCDRKMQSKPQDEICEWLKSFGFVINPNDRSVIPPLELDIYIPSNNIAIEFNGLYWHSEISGNKDKYYHLDKTKKCETLGIQLIHVFEDEWAYNKNIVKSRLMNILGITPNKIFARKCEIRSISSKEKKEFLNNYHIQGDCRSSFNVGAFYGDELVSVMTFGKRRFDSKDGYELLRFANKEFTSVVGIGSRLLKFAENNYITDSLISYCDLRWSIGNLYFKLGFNHVRTSVPNYFYVNKSIREPRQKYQKHKLEDKLDIFNSNISEWKNMKINGYDRIWDCGNMVFEKTYN